MHNFKKTLLSTILFILIFAILSATIIVPYHNSDDFYYLDASVRKDLAGTVDCIFLGASHGLTSFVPALIDEQLGCNSYNLSCSMMTLYGKYELLKKELDRNPVEKVVLEISFDTLSRNQRDEYAIGDEPTIARLDTIGEKLNYIFKYISVNDWANIYARSIENGLVSWKNLLTRSFGGFDCGSKGFHRKESIDVSLPEKDFQSSYNRSTISVNYIEENKKQLDAIVALCKENNVKVHIVVVPISDSLIWSMDNWDNFRMWCEDYCRQNDCGYIDFNLLKNRYDIFSDERSYYDADHMSEEGAMAFSDIYCDIIVKYEAGEDISDYFYPTYEALKQDSPYKE